LVMRLPPRQNLSGHRIMAGIPTNGKQFHFLIGESDR
jgi:hypothetical protein